MKKRARTLIILGAALVVCIGAYIAVTVYNNRQAQITAETAKADQLYANGRTEPVLLSYESGGVTMSFVLEDSKWCLADNKDFPLKQSSLTSLATTFNDLTAVRTLDMPSDLSTYGLDAPAYTVTGTDAAGNGLTLLIGAAYEDYYYAMISGGDKIYTIASTIVSYLNTDLMSMIILDTIPTLSETTVDTIRLDTGTASLTLDKHQNKDSTYTWFIIDGTTYTAAEDFVLPEGIEKLPEKYAADAVTALASARFSSCAVFQPEAAAVTACGLDAPRMTITVDYTTTTGSGLNQTSEKGTVILEIGGALDDGSGYYARIPGSQQINVLPADAVTPLDEALSVLGVVK